MSDAANDHAMEIMNIQHAEPSVYYCYKFWFSTGRVEEGCTPVMSSRDLFLDPNEYGWVYMTVPIVGLFLLVLIFYVICGSGKSKTTPAQPPMDADLISEIGVAPTYRQAGPVAPPYNAARGLYSVIPMDTFDHQNPHKPRIYPSLPNGGRSTMRRQPQEMKPMPAKKSASVDAEVLLKEKKHARNDSVLSSDSSIEDIAH